MEQVKKIVSTLNEAEVPSEDFVGKYAVDKAPWNLDCKFMLKIGLKNWLALPFENKFCQIT